MKMFLGGQAPCPPYIRLWKNRTNNLGFGVTTAAGFPPRGSSVAHQSTSWYCVWHNIVIAALTSDWWCACATFTLIDELSDSCLLFAYVNERVCAASRMLYLHRLLVITHGRQVKRLKHSDVGKIVSSRVGSVSKYTTILYWSVILFNSNSVWDFDSS